MTLASEARVQGVVNDFAPLSSGAIQISPFGKFPHPRGMQFFAAEDASKLVAEFNKQQSLAPRTFCGAPWFEGHPDTNPTAYPNKRAYGWIRSLESRADGLYGNVRWTKAGDELIQSETYKFFSPVWDAAPALVGGKRVLRPTRFVSVGFTNTPNLPVLPLSNEGDGVPKEVGGGEVGRELSALVNALMIEHSASYDGAWRRAKLERPDLFSRMRHPANARPLIPPKKAA